MSTAPKQTSTTSMIIDGVAASEAIDSSGEILDVKGCDISDFENGVGLLNYEHRGDTAQGASGNDIVGRITYAKKVFKKDDCEDKRQEAYWNHVKLPFIYIRARLYDGAEHPGAKALAAAIRDAVMHKEPILLRFSIEGSTLKKEGNRLLRTIGRKVALTFKPANKSAISGLISDPSGPKPITEKQGEKSLLSQLLEDDTTKSEAPGQQRLGGYEMESNPIVEEDVVELLKNVAENIRDLAHDSYEWHPIEYDFLSPIGLTKAEVRFNESYQPLEFALGTNKLRQLRDYLISHRMKKVNENDPRLPVPIKQALAHTGRDYDGNFSVERIQKLIDEKPKLKFNHSTGLYEYIQRHNDLPSQVFQLNLTNEQAAKLNDAGVLGSFLNMHSISQQSQHPVVPGTIGWVRWTGNRRGVHIDEVQSDYGRKWSALIDHQLGEATSKGQISPEQAASMRADLVAKLPDEHLKVIQKTLFGNKHPAEVLHEAFHHWARENGLAGAPVHIWTPKSKATMNGMDPNQPLPGHYNVTYKDVPEKMGMTPGKYGDLPTQNNPELVGERPAGTIGEDVDWKGSNSTYQDKIRKSEELAKTTTGGGANAAPSTLIGSDALAREDDRLHQHDFKNKLRAAIRDMGVEVVGKQAMLKFFKWQLPEVNERFLDHFTDLIADVRAKSAGDVLDKVIAKWETPMSKAQDINLAPDAPPKEEKPKKERAKRAPKEKPPVPAPIESYKPTPEAENPMDVPPQGRSKKGLVGGLLSVPGLTGTGLHLHDFGSDQTMLDILHADEPSVSPSLAPEQREHILNTVHRPWQRAMQNWMILNKLAREGQLPPTVIAHGAIFAAMSPNTSVPIQELYYGHYMDFRRQHPDLFTNPQGISPEDAIAFHRHLNSVLPPEFFNSYYTVGPGTMKYGDERLATRAGHGTVAGLKSAQAQLVDRPQGKPLINYHKAHPTLTALHRNTKDDGRSFVDYIMQQKSDSPGAFMYGFGPKLARYMGLMLGMGNMIVPDRHMMRSLFNLSLAQKPEFMAVQRALAPVEGERILRGLDNHFFDKSPAVHKTLRSFPEHFRGHERQAVGPGFWLHWLAYPQYEQMLGRPTENANAGTAHDPFWHSIKQIMDEEGIPHDMPATDEPWMKKSMDMVGLPERVARATKRVEEMHGENPAMFFFYSYGVPALVHNAEMNRLPDQYVRKSEFEAIEEASLMKREHAEIEVVRLCKALDLEGKDEIYSVDGDYAHGRFWVKDGQLRILEDHEGVLGRYLHNGSVEDNRAGIGQIVMEGHRIKPEAPIEEGKEIEMDGDPTSDQIQPGAAPETVEDVHMGDEPEDIVDPEADTAAPPPPIFDLMVAGSSKPSVIEIKGNDVFENGHKLDPDDSEYLLNLVHTGKATLRYRKEAISEHALNKMAKQFEDMFKTAPEVRQAMSGLHSAVKAGHVKPEHADAIRRGLFTDRLTGNRIGNQAAHEDFLEGLKGKSNQGVHVHLDANDFGSINKMHGMPVGDKAIKLLANTMRDTIDKHVGRKNAKLFRVGGDEFKAHFHTPQHAAAFMRALRTNLDQLVPVGGTHRLSVSMGMGHNPESAEQALMNAKTEKKRHNYPVGQAEHHAHSMLPGNEGPVPLAPSPFPSVHMPLR